MRKAFVVLAAGLCLLACKPENGTAPVASGRNTAIKSACQADIQKFCASETKFHHCLKKNMSQLSDTCKTAMAARDAAKEAKKKRKQAAGNSSNASDN